ncbi:MAG: SLC13 family permease [Anaerolineae bacterium]
MTPEIGLVLGIIAAAIVLFATEKLRVDLVALLVLLALALTGLIGPTEVFSGFASPAVITVWAVYIVSQGLFKTGVADFLGERIIRVAGTSEPRLVAITMLTCGTMSAFMNNIGATAMLLPAVVGISRQARIPLSKLLIPLSFASLMGGNLTLIGTPPNILANDLLQKRGLPGFTFFDYTPMGLIVFGSGILYMVLLGRHLLPVRRSTPAGQSATLEPLRAYVSEVRVPAGSPLVGQTLLQSRLGADYDLTVISILRERAGPGELAARNLAPNRDTVLEADDLLLIEGRIEALMRACQSLKLTIEAQRKLGLPGSDARQICTVEATLAPRSPIAGHTLRGLQFRDRYGFTALAIWRHGEVITERIRDVRLRFGDTLLLQGPCHRLAALQAGNEFLVLEPVDLALRKSAQVPFALAALATVLLLATVVKLPIALAMVIGAVLMILTGCLTMDEAYQSIEWRSVFLIAGMLPLGLAMESTGTARFLADQVIGVMGPLGPLGVLAGIYLLASVTTEPMSNAAAALLIVPIAIDVALGLGADPRPFVLATVIGASTSFLTPMGHQANVLVFGPGGYRFFDYTRVGAPLNLVIFAATMLTLPVVWPLFP